METKLPARYARLSVLGHGGGGQVWAVRDQLTNKTVALKALAEGASEREVQALVREAVALSGLEGLGFPRVLRFGRLPETRRAYMVRELVQGESLASLIEAVSPSPRVCLGAIARAADQLTGLHRAGLLHGDVKPANIIVASDGGATLVDLGLAAPWREGGTRPEGLTPQYAAPELFAGLPLTVRAEIYALGASLSEVVDRCASSLEPHELEQLKAIAARATHEDPSSRFPSADELASSLRQAARLRMTEADVAADAAWAVVGEDAPANLLLTQIGALAPGAVLCLEGKHGSGRTVLLRRVAWTLGVEGREVAWVEQQGSMRMLDAIEMELGSLERDEGSVMLVDDAERLQAPAIERLSRARSVGARVVLVAPSAVASKLGGTVETFAIPPIDPTAAAGLVRRAIPSLSDGLVDHVIARADGRPGRLRAIVRAIGNHAVVTPADVDRLLEQDAGGKRTSVAPASGLREIDLLLDQGRFEEAATAMAQGPAGDPVSLSIARARLALGRGDPKEALGLLDQVRGEAEARGAHVRRHWSLQQARALLRLGKYAEASQFARATACSDSTDPVAIEGLSTLGLLQSYSGDHEEAARTLRDAAERAGNCKDRRVRAVCLAALAVSMQRAGKMTEAVRAYEESLEAAEAAGDAGAVANTRLNLAGVTQLSGDLAGAIKHLEAAIDMGRRAGRGSTVRQALLNLANLDIYLGRYAKARSSIATLSEQRDQLTAILAAQLAGLEAELEACTGEVQGAAALFENCAKAYEALGRQLDAAEARLEGVMVAAAGATPDAAALSRIIEQATVDLGESGAHRGRLGLARGMVLALQGDEDRAKSAYDEAIESARQAGQREWIWKTLQARSRLLYEMGQGLAARRDSEEALSVLEEIASRLPRDLREVFWDDPRRRAVRASHLGTVASAKAQSVPMAQSIVPSSPGGRMGVRTSFSATIPGLPIEERLARLLEINRELAREHTLERLLERVTDHAITLLNAERGFVIMARNGELVVHTSRDRKGEDPSAKFSRSIAEKVVATGEPMVTLSAGDDERMANYLSVHQLNVQSVACVPIRTPEGRAAGALYLETRIRPGALFHAELPTLMAFADQAAIAIENAHLMQENAKRADELAAANAELTKAHARLEELLGHRTAQLESTRRDLASTRAVLRSHFGYHGLVGTSSKMRRVYALIDRLKDMDVPVLVTGESGTGKEVVARAIHTSGARAKKPFTGINCGAIPEHLLESELFGHVRGAFTGADRDRKGLFRESEGGTILLDEIGEMPPKMQAGLLRVLQDKVVRPVGGVREETVEVRVIAATNRDLLKMVGEGTFREDLYYRLHVVEVNIPSLRDRTEDIPVLIDHFLQIFAARYRRERKTISREALRFLCSCPWPGNVRQLENTLLNAWVMSDRPELVEEDFELAGLKRAITGVEPSTPPSAGRALEASLVDHEQSEKERILAALTSANWNRVKAAEMCGIPRRTFYRRLRKHGIQ